MKITISKSQWENMGKKAGWIKTANMADNSRHIDFLNAIKNPQERSKFPKIDPLEWDNYRKQVELMGETNFLQNFLSKDFTAKKIL